MRVFDAHCSLLTTLQEGEMVETMNQLPLHGHRQHSMSLLEHAFNNLDLEPDYMSRSMSAKECTHVCLQALVREVRVEEANPQHCRSWSAHDTRPVGRDRFDSCSPHRAPMPGLQHSIEL